MADKKSSRGTVNLKLSVHDFGETCHEIMDAFERGEPTVRTSLAMVLVGHIHAVLKDQVSSEILGKSLLWKGDATCSRGEYQLPLLTLLGDDFDEKLIPGNMYTVRVYGQTVESEADDERP